MKGEKIELIDEKLKKSTGITGYIYNINEDKPKRSLILQSTSKLISKVELSYPDETNVKFENLSFNSNENKDDIENNKIMIQLFPLERVQVGFLVPKDEQLDWKPKKFTYTVHNEKPDKDSSKKEIKKNQENIEKCLIETQHLFEDLNDTKLSKILEICKNKKLQFIDPTFPPTSSSVWSPIREPKTANKNSDDIKLNCEEDIEHEEDEIVWKRPNEFSILSENQHESIFYDSIEPNDIYQGALGDCWFLCAIASIAEFPDLVYQLFQEEISMNLTERNLITFNHEGVYHVHLCKGGQWKTVIIDDFFPCSPMGGPLYTRGHGEELWVLLLEKAYAKLHGGYKQLRMGYAYEAMMDLTGCPTITIRFDDEDVQDQVKNGELWKQLLEFDDNGYLLSLSTPGEDKWTEIGIHGDIDNENSIGLVPGHAYTLLSVKETSTKIKLMQIRNPWGSFEWKGDWSDNSPLWTQELLKEREQWNVVKEEKSAPQDDGLFWMCLEDVLSHFHSINACMMRHPKISSREWQVIRRKGCFHFVMDKEDMDHDGNTKEMMITTPLYKLVIEKDSYCYFGIHQEDERILSAKPYIDIGLIILRVKCEEKNEYEFLSTTGNAAERQAQMNIFLEKGTYLLIPTSTGCRFSYQMKQASKISSSNSTSLVDWIEKEKNKFEFTSNCRAALKEIHNRLDSDMDSVLNKLELQQILHVLEGKEMPEHVYEWLLETFDSKNGGLTSTGFLQCYEYMFEKSDFNEEVIWKDLEYMGYNKHLHLLYARSYTISIHSDEKIQIQSQSFDAELYENAMEDAIRKKGKSQALTTDDAVKLYSLKSSYSGISFAVENVSKEPILFKMDCSGSTNVISHTGSLIVEETIPSNETKIIHHLMPMDRKGWSLQAVPNLQFLSK